MYQPHPSGNHLPHLEDEHLLLPGNCTATWGEVAPSESSLLHRFCHKCLYVNDSMSDNLQSQPLPLKPPDRMTTFISRTFNVACFTHTPDAVGNTGNHPGAGSSLLFFYLCRDQEEKPCLESVEADNTPRSVGSVRYTSGFRLDYRLVHQPQQT